MLLEVGVELVAEAADPLARPLLVGLPVRDQFVPRRENALIISYGNMLRSTHCREFLYL